MLARPPWMRGFEESKTVGTRALARADARGRFSRMVLPPDSNHLAVGFAPSGHKVQTGTRSRSASRSASPAKVAIFGSRPQLENRHSLYRSTRLLNMVHMANAVKIMVLLAALPHLALNFLL